MAITLTRPAAGETVNVAANKEQLKIVLSFPLADAILERDGDNLAMSFDGGEKIVIENFYTEYTGKEIPDFVVEDATVTGEEFFKSLNDEKLMPAAGPEGSEDGGRFYDYDPAALARGIDALGKVAGGSDYGRFGELDPGEVAGRPAAPGVAIVWDSPLNANPTLPEGVAAPSLGLPGGWVSESGLQNGSLPGDALHPISTTGTITITAPGGLRDVLINGAPLASANVSDGVGNFTFGTPVNNGNGTYTLTFTYTLTGNTGHPDGQDQNWLAGDLPSFTVAVIDNYGQTSPTATTTVQILDDIPAISIDGEATGAYNATVTGSVDMAFGADGEQSVAVTLGNETVTGVKGADGNYTFTFDNGKVLTLNGTNGDFSYNGVPGSGAAATYEFTFTITDTDGDIDTASTTATITATNTENLTGTVTSYDVDVAGATSQSVTVNNLPAGATLVAGTYAGEYGTITVAANGKITFTQSVVYSHPDTTGADTKEGVESIGVTVKLADGSEVTMPVKVSIVDDIPTIRQWSKITYPIFRLYSV